MNPSHGRRNTVTVSVQPVSVISKKRFCVVSSIHLWLSRACSITYPASEYDLCTKWMAADRAITGITNYVTSRGKALWAVCNAHICLAVFCLNSQPRVLLFISYRQIFDRRWSGHHRSAHTESAAIVLLTLLAHTDTTHMQVNAQ